MKLSEIYREAAWRIEGGHEKYGCIAIEGVAAVWDDGMIVNWSHVDTAIASFSEYFRPENTYSRDPWFGRACTANQQNRRILALCFMAAIAESEGE